MSTIIELFTEYDIPAAFWVNIQLTLWSARPRRPALWG